jgi:hypothetical protein
MQMTETEKMQGRHAKRVTVRPVLNLEFGHSNFGF